MKNEKMDADWIRRTGITGSTILLNPNLECTPDAVEALMHNQRNAIKNAYDEFEENCKSMGAESAGMILQVRLMFAF